MDINLDEAVYHSVAIMLNYSNMKRVKFYKYSRVFLATSENIKGYLEQSEFNKNRALTVLASGDHVFNLIYHGLQEIDAFDINVLTYFIYHLKKAMIKVLTYQEFMQCYYYFRCTDYNNEIIKTIEWIKRLLPPEVYEYFRRIMEFVQMYNIPLSHLSYGVRTDTTALNAYLENEEAYQSLKNKLEDADVNLHFGDVMTIPKRVAGNYDIILLSNIADYLGSLTDPLKINEFEAYLAPFKNMLNDDGVLINYLYHANRDNIINRSSISLQDLGKENVIGFDYVRFTGEAFYRVRKQGSEICQR